ncbi:hypothetical protein AVEN_85237-1 [Araneus ventricosus]|uniref:Uncharacterized protein n=1 Tax=Araneus ventricosus TaxID=182803 RepID=A0A4Y2SJQ9_ARAVE|nr:hypothetical protein AVEN_85237-1 [Araneus ventricosus]
MLRIPVLTHFHNSNIEFWRQADIGLAVCPLDSKLSTELSITIRERKLSFPQCHMQMLECQRRRFVCSATKNMPRCTLLSPVRKSIDFRSTKAFEWKGRKRDLNEKTPASGNGFHRRKMEGVVLSAKENVCLRFLRWNFEIRLR